MKGNALVYVVGAVVAIFVLQLAVGAFFEVLPTLLFVAGVLVATLCGYAIYTEKDGRRIEGFDRFLGLMPPPTMIRVAPVETLKNAHGAGTTVFTDAPQRADFKVTRAQEVTTVPPDDPSETPGTAQPPPSVARPAPPKPPARSAYGDVIEQMRKAPPPPPKQPAPIPSSTRVDEKPRGTLDYGNLVARMQATPAQIISKDDLIAAIAKNVIGQRAAIETMATYTRGKLGARDSGKSKPLVFLLPGPTGTGKTEISKAIATALGTKLIRYDMGEYAEEFKASNLFGSPKGYIGSEDGGALPNAIRRGSKRLVILFDEVEKAHQSIWQKMLAFMDEGRTGDSKGEVAAPKDTIVLLTTNRQAEAVGNDPDHAREILQHDGYFSPEFLGRVEKIVPMPRLTDVDLMQLTHRLADVLAHQYGLSLVIEEDALVELFLASRDAAVRAGGRGITERLRDLLLEDFIELQAEGCEIGQVTFGNGRVRALPA